MVLRNLLILFLIFSPLLSNAYQNQYKDHYIVNDTASYIRNNSYFYEKEQHKDIFIKSINAINSYSDDILIKVINDNKSKLELEIKGQNKIKKFIVHYTSLKDVGLRLSELIHTLEDEYNLDNEDMSLDYLIANTMLQDVDEYSSIIHPDLFDEFLIESKGSFGGLGIVIGIRNERLTIISPIEGTPAERAGIKANDKIVRIENFETDGFTLEQAIKLLRGDEGTPITIYVERDNVSDLLEFKIVRDIIKIKSVESKTIDKKIGYIKINSFQSNTYDEFIILLNEIRDNGGQSLILDLRGNPGGLFDQALRISNIFLKEKLIVSTKSKSKEMNINFFTHGSITPKFDGPLIVLIDAGSASASEIVTGAIKGNNRGIVIGQQSFGKGTVQEIYKQDDGSGIKLTIAEYLSPIINKVHLNGISPDINFIPINVKENNLIVDNEIDGELANESIKSFYNIIYTPKELIDDEIDELVSFSKYILNSEILNKIQLRGNTKNFLNILETYIQSEGVKINNSFTKNLENFSILGKNFNENIKNIKLEIENKESIAFKPGSNKKIKGRIKNNSGHNLNNIIIKSESENKAFDNKYFYVGDVSNKKVTQFNINFELPTWIQKSNDIIKLTLMRLDMSHSLKPKLEKISQISFQTEVYKKKFNFPQFSYSLKPIKINDKLDLGLTIRTIDVPFNCEKCFMKIFSEDKNLIIKNKRHKLSSNTKKVNNSSNISIPFKDIKRNKIEFTIRFQDENTRALFDKNIIIHTKEFASFKFKENSYNIIHDAKSFSEPSENGIVIGELKKDSIIKTIGETENFVLIQSNNKDFITWLMKSDLLLTTNKRYNYKIIKTYESPPKILIESRENKKQKAVNINAKITDNSSIKNINYFLNDKKIRLNIENKKIINENFNIELKPGRNKFYIVASDNKNIKTYKEIYLTSNEN